MSDAVNPYQSPETVAVPEKPLTAQGTLTESMLLYLKGASPWLMFLGILGFIGAGFMVLGGIIFMALAPMMTGVWSEVPGMEEAGKYLGAAFSGGIAVIYIGIGVLLFFPAFFKYRFGEKIRSYLRTGMEQELELAFRNNKSLWKFLGIISIIELAVIPVMIIVGIIAAVAIAVS